MTHKTKAKSGLLLPAKYITIIPNINPPKKKNLLYAFVVVVKKKKNIKENVKAQCPKAKYESPSLPLFLTVVSNSFSFTPALYNMDKIRTKNNIQNVSLRM